MGLCIIAVGSKMPAWVQEGYREYAKRLPKEIKPKLVELPLANRGKNLDLTKAIAKEGEQILSALTPNSLTIALDVKGKSWSTRDLAHRLQNWRMQGQSVNFLIGGPDGLAPDCLAKAEQSWSLSALTLPHPLVRVVLIEQLYRAWTILHNHPYHK